MVIALGIRLDSPGPILARDRRVGRHGREFDLLRFRIAPPVACRDDGVEQGEGVEQGYDFERGWGELSPSVSVGPVTEFGRFLHRYCLDELPQLLNVLRGEMSLVGPRPTPPPSAGDGARSVLLPVKPGLTGLWGGGGRAGFPSEQPMDVDEYVRKYSLVLDLSILWFAVRSLPRDGGGR
jgi:lipopolysaccharide/colanic/teichoic acid biosynthesis glycosyltransferase